MRHPAVVKMGAQATVVRCPRPRDWTSTVERVYMVPPKHHAPARTANACSTDVDGGLGVFQTEPINADQWVAIWSELLPWGTSSPRPAPGQAETRKRPYRQGVGRTPGETPAPF